MIFGLQRYICLPQKIHNLFFRFDIYKVIIINLNYSIKYEHLKKKINEFILNGAVCLVKDSRFITNENAGIVICEENIKQLKERAKEIISNYWLWRTVVHRGYRQLMTDQYIYNESALTK